MTPLEELLAQQQAIAQQIFEATNQQREAALQQIKSIIEQFDFKSPEIQRTCFAKGYYIADQYSTASDILSTKEDTPLAYALPHIKDYKPIVLTLVKNDASNYQYASPRLKLDREVIVETIKADVESIKHIPQEQITKDIALYVAYHQGMLLDDLPDIYKCDKEVVLNAVGNNGDALQYASKELKEDKDIVLVAVKDKYKTPLKHLNAKHSRKPNPLWEDFDVAMEAVKANGNNLQYFSEELRNNIEIAYTACQGSSFVFHYIGNKLKEEMKLHSNDYEQALSILYEKHSLSKVRPISSIQPEE